MGVLLFESMDIKILNSSAELDICDYADDFDSDSHFFKDHNVYKLAFKKSQMLKNIDHCPYD